MRDHFIFPWVRWADRSSVSRQNPMAARRIYDHELVYVLEGQGYFELEGESFSAGPNQLFLLQPSRWHRWRIDAGHSLHLLGVHFDWTPRDDTLLYPIFRPALEPVETGLFREPREIPGWDLNLMPTLDLRGRPRLRRELEDLVVEYHRPESDAREVASALLINVLLTISREARRIKLGLENIPPDAMRRVQRARQMLENHESPCSLEEAAASVGWSTDHMRRMFRRGLGLSPGSVQTNARMVHARNLLRDTNLAIGAVALRCGFDDPSHFARVFKSECGISPREFLSLSKRL